MRQSVIVTIAVAIAIAAIWGTTAIIARPSQTAVSRQAKSIDVMGLMKNAKNLPEEKFDAH